MQRAASRAGLRRARPPGRGVRRAGAAARRLRRQRRRRAVRRRAARPTRACAVEALLLEPRQGARRRARRPARRRGPRRRLGRGRRPRPTWSSTASSASAAAAGCATTRPRVVAVAAPASRSSPSTSPRASTSTPGTVDGPHVRPTVTVTFGTHKVAHLVDPAALACGAVHLVDIGLDLPAAGGRRRSRRTTCAALLPRPAPDAHKYTRGVVGVRAGSEQYPGAGRALRRPARAPAWPAWCATSAAPTGPGPRPQHPEVVVGAGRVQAWVVGSGGGADAEQALRRRARRRASRSSSTPTRSTPRRPARSACPRCSPRTPASWPGCSASSARRSRPTSSRFAREAAAAVRRAWCCSRAGTRSSPPRPGDVRVTTVGPAWLATAGAGDVLAGLVRVAARRRPRPLRRRSRSAPGCTARPRPSPGRAGRSPHRRSRRRPTLRRACSGTLPRWDSGHAADLPDWSPRAEIVVDLDAIRANVAHPQARVGDARR